MPWRPIQTMPRGVMLLTKIDDKDGVRCTQRLKLGTDNNLFWCGDGVYVYYTPTHWFNSEE